MKKVMIVISLCFIFIFGVANVSAANYSKTKTGTTTLLNGKYKTSCTATYHTVGDTRWSYSNESLVYSSGTVPKSYYISKKETTVNSKSGNIYYVTRKHSYKALSTTTTATGFKNYPFNFDISKNKWVED